MQPILNRPIDYLLTGLAYAIMADKTALASERAKLLSIMQKHVDKGDVAADWLQSAVPDAIRAVGETPAQDFLDRAYQRLTPAQRMALTLNMLDAVMVDGSTSVEEHTLMQKLRQTFDIDEETWRTLVEVLRIKNETALFVDERHPANRPDFYVQFRRN